MRVNAIATEAALHDRELQVQMQNLGLRSSATACSRSGSYAASLGASVAEGLRIETFCWRTTYARRQQTTPTYWSAECRDGGTYDLRPASHGWPS